MFIFEIIFVVGTVIISVYSIIKIMRYIDKIFPI